MADKDGFKVAKDYHVGVPFANQEGFYVKGANALDWGMKKHMSNIFDAKSGNTVMFAFDHGYFMGSTAGLERLDLIIPKLIPNIDVLMGTRGALRSCVDPALIGGKGVALRATSGSSMLNDDLSHEVLAVDAAEACRMNADCLAIQTFVGADGQLSSLDNLSKAVNLGQQYSIPVMGVVAVGKQMERTDRFFKLATRMVAELGANIVKSYYCDNFEEVTVKAKVARKDSEGKRVKEVVDGKKVTVYDEVQKEIKKDAPSRLHARRQMLKVLYPVKEVPTAAAGKKKNTKEVDLTEKLFTEIAPKYADRNGGYTRIIKIGPRKGDAAMEVVLELV